MGFFSGQLANVVEWDEHREDAIFWKWNNDEIKRGSRLIIRPGQDAVFLYNGAIDGIFTEDGSYDIESEIIPFLSTLKGFRFGFNSGLRAEVLFVNTKEFTIKWGTKNAINLPAPGLPGGMPIRAFGTYQIKVADFDLLIENVAGIKRQFLVEDIRERLSGVIDQLLMKWIAREGRDMFNLQANAYDICKGMREDIDAELMKIGISCSGIQIQSISYPEEIAKMQQKAAAQSMVADTDKYMKMAMADNMAKGGKSNAAGTMMEAQMGMMMGAQMMRNMAQSMTPDVSSSQASQSASTAASGSDSAPNFCPNCGTKTNGANFCPNCGQKLV